MTLVPAFRVPPRVRFIPSALALLLLAHPARAQQPAATHTAVEELRIGRVNDPGYNFSPRIQVAVGSGGEIYVLDPLELRVRAFDARGRLARSFGREGPGPGEFLAARALGWLGDTLWVADQMQLRITFFRPNGSVIRTLPISTRVSTLYSPRLPTAMLADGSALVIGSPPADLAADGTVRRSPVLRVDRGGRPLDTLAWHPSGGYSLRVVDGDRRLFVSTPIQDAPLVEAGPDGRNVVIVEREAAQRGDRGYFRVTRLSASGDTVYSRRYAYPPIPTPREFRRTWANEQGEEIAKSMRGLSRGAVTDAIYEQLNVPPFYPPVTDVVVGRDGTVWLRREEGEGETVLWQVLNERGGIEANVRVPKAAKVQQASRTHLWAVIQDEVDVPYVVRYRVRPAAPPRRR